VKQPKQVSISKTILNEEERPRVLIATQERQSQFKFIEAKPGSFKYIESLTEVDLEEWDVIITDRQLAAATYGHDGVVKWWNRRVPLGLNIFFVHDPDMPVSESDVLDGLVVSEDQNLLAMTIRERVGVPGKHATRIDGLPDAIQTLANQILVPLMGGRDRQFGHDSHLEKDASNEGTHYRPFMAGPGELVIAASYSRGPNSEVWVLPSDLTDFEPWYDLALAEWHTLDANRFPGAPGWVDSKEWMTNEQSLASAQIDAERSAFAPTLEAHEEQIARLTAELDGAADEAASVDRHMLTGQGSTFAIWTLSGTSASAEKTTESPTRQCPVGWLFRTRLVSLKE